MQEKIERLKKKKGLGIGGTHIISSSRLESINDKDSKNCDETFGVMEGPSGLFSSRRSSNISMLN